MKGSTLLCFLLFMYAVDSCHPCYNTQTENCQALPELPTTLHMSVHPHLDAYWIFNFQSYYEPQPTEGEVHGYFASNRFHSVKNIFDTAREVLWESKKYRQNKGNHSQFGHRTFMNSQMGFFKRWYRSINETDKNQVKQLLKTKYWEILGGGFVEHDQGCAYYDDIIENFQVGLNFLEEEFGYKPKVAISADSFGHSQTTLAILAHLGIEGFFVERSDEHILLQNKTEFIWKAKSSNKKYYGALPTHIRWAIHGFEDQFNGGGNPGNQMMCQTKSSYIQNMHGENKFLKKILRSSHIMRYFGHDFQKFDNYSYTVIQKIMEQFSRQKCPGVTATYSNPTEYFTTLMGEVYGGKVKPIKTREEDIMPIWDYDSGLYWTGYYTTDQYNKKNYRDVGRFLYALRKLYLPLYLSDSSSSLHTRVYQVMEELAEQVSYLQHHDGISGTSKYMVMDTLWRQNQKLVETLKKTALEEVFEDTFPLGTEGSISVVCMSGGVEECKLPKKLGNQDILIKILNSDAGGKNDAGGYHEEIVIQLPFGVLYQADCQYEINCFCVQEQCPCKIYLYPQIFTYTAIRLKKVEPNSGIKINRLKSFQKSAQASYNQSHFTITLAGKSYGITYIYVDAMPTSRSYDHLTRYGTQSPRGFTVRPGKYALGNDPKTARVWTDINCVYQLESRKGKYFLIKWKRQGMKTLISIKKNQPNEWKVETLTAAQQYYTSDLYLVVESSIKNGKTFHTDSNGWLTLPRTLYHHQDYSAYFSPGGHDDIDGNSYPCTAFVYIQDSDDKISVNVDRPQGVIGWGQGKIWINFERLSQDDGKWVYQSAVRNQYQKWTHTITVQNKDYNQRKIQRLYDQPYFIQSTSIAPNAKIQDINVDKATRDSWASLSHLPQLKFSLKALNQSKKAILRLHNLNDQASVNVGLFAKEVVVALTTYYGKIVRASKIEEMSLGANMRYEQFIQNKWNWNKVVNLTEENSIFTKTFGENITLRPLELRTFLLTNLTIQEPCVEANALKYSGLKIEYTLDIKKPMPVRPDDVKERENEIKNWGLKGDHCNKDGPVLEEKEGKGIIDKVKDFMSSGDQKKPETVTPPNPIAPRPTVTPLNPVTPPPSVTPLKPPPSPPQPSIEPPALQLFSELKQKVLTLQPLTLEQKVRYFKAKRQQIRRIIYHYDYTADTKQ